MSTVDTPAVVRGPTLADRWFGFWFTAQPATTLGLIRIAFGLLMVGWTFSLLPDLLNLFGRGGVVAAAPSVHYTWGLLHVWSSDRAVFAVWLALLAGALALTVGWHSRLAALVVYVGVMSFERRNPFVFNSGDALLRIEALYLVLAPSGAALSLDRRRTAGSFWSAQMRAPWVVRLMQVQLSVIYLATVREKLNGSTWPAGSAVSYSLRLTDLQNFPVPHWLVMNPLLMNLASWGTLASEVLIGMLVWNRVLRPWLLGVGVVLHLSILLTLAIAFFSFGMFILYLAFLPPEVAQRWVDRVRARLRRSNRQPPAVDGVDADQTPPGEPSRAPTAAEPSGAVGEPAQQPEPAEQPERPESAGRPESAAAAGGPAPADAADAQMPTG
jgi:hypothetical protein